MVTKLKNPSILGLVMSIFLNSLSIGATPTWMKFSKKATGGTLKLLWMIDKGDTAITVKTQAGEDPESVVASLVETANNSEEFVNRVGGKLFDGRTWWDSLAIPKRLIKIHPRVKPGLISARRLCLPNGSCYFQFLFAGTETGLGIPPAPKSVSASYGKRSDQFFIYFDVDGPRSQMYEEVWVRCAGIEMGGRYEVLNDGRGLYTILETTKQLQRIGKTPEESLTFYVIGSGEGNIPGNAGVVCVKGRVQKEVDNIPFTSGVAPNWTGWENNIGNGRLELKQGSISTGKQSSLTKSKEKGFYQVIIGRSGSFEGGVWRKFLGLTPGHTYKISVRVNTFSLDSSSAGDWVFSVHACYDDQTAKKLTVDQLAGKAVLPDGSAGRMAGQIAKYTGNINTEGRWVTVSTGARGIDNIKLPPDVTSITVWLRLKGRNMNRETEVGKAGIALKDVTR